MTVVKGGFNLYGRSIGILMLQTRFPRIPGDLGNATCFPFPVSYRVVQGASPHRVVTAGEVELLAPFVEAARERPVWDIMVLLEAVQSSLHRQPYRGYQR
jgi:hypothetical protein